MDGLRLFEIVADYTGLGDHRTGTAVDDATLAWFADQLAGHGLVTRREPFEFPRYRWQSVLTVDGAPVAHIPVFYAFAGRRDTTDVRVELVDGTLRGGRHEVLDPVLAAARADGVGAVAIALEHPQGLLIGVNHPPAEPNGVPAVLVGGKDLDRLRAGALRLQLAASVVPGASGNVVARRGEEHAAPLMISTPLSGWFGCAGERGTGIAVLLGVLDRLPADLPVLVVATSGHELEFLGAHRALGTIPTGAAAPVAVVHLGASVGVVDDAGNPVVRANTTEEIAGVAGIAAALATVGIETGADDRRWIGEAGVWRTRGVPVLSIAGAGAHFHTPEDLPEAVTSPDRLAAVTDAVAAASLALWREVRASADNDASAIVDAGVRAGVTDAAEEGRP